MQDDEAFLRATGRMQRLMTQQELPDDADEGCVKYRFIGEGRLILETMHGPVTIDIRRDDVNAFTNIGPRVDHLLIPKR